MSARVDGGLEQLRLFERPAGDAANVRVELVERAGLDGVVAGIVRTWGQFVDDDLVVFGDEQFDGQNAGEFEAFGQSQRQLVRLLGHGFVHFGRRDGHVQDVVAMLVAHDREGHVILAVAGDEDARFEREIDEAFQNAWREAATCSKSASDLSTVWPWPS